MQDGQEQGALTGTENDARPLTVPDWTAEQFMEPEPYEWLYKFRNNAFVLSQMLARAQKRAREVKFAAFTKMWNAFLSSKKQTSPTVVGENDTAFPGQENPLRCRYYNCDENGISYTNALGQTVEVLSHPLLPLRRIRNLDSGEEKLEIGFIRGTKADTWTRFIESKDVLASSQKIIALAKRGVAVNSENAKELVNFITKIESSNYDDLPKQDSTGHLGWLPDGQFSPYCNDVVYDGDNPEFKRIFDGFSGLGSEDTWMRVARETRAGKSVPARMALAASFAAPLVKVCNGLPFFVHLWGTQGCGKTVGLMLAASVWGNPEVGQYIKTFNGTKVSQEAYASFCGNVPILLDELQIAADRKSFDDIIYMLCEGASKGRGSKDGGLQLQRRWASTIITTGEMPIVQSNSGGGALVRCIEVNFGGEPLFRDSRSVAETLKKNYGFAGRKFIEELKNPENVEALRETQRRYFTVLTGDIQEKQVLAASILLAADKLADAAIFHDGKALTVDDVRPYLVTHDQADVNVRAYNWLTGFIGGNPRRFQDDDEQNGELWGVIEKGVCYFNRTFFDRALLSEGYSPGSFLTWADRTGKIIREQYGKGSNNNRLTVRKTIAGSRVACIALRMPTEEDETSSPDASGMTPVDDDDMPF